MMNLADLFGFGPPKLEEAPYKATSPTSLTLEEAKALVERGKWDKEGVRCPCCDRYAKVYRRSLNSTMARFLIWLVRNYGTDPRWYDIKEYPHARGGDHAKLVYWGMVEQHSNDDPTKSHSGHWRPTSFGIAFGQRQARVQSHAVVYANELLGHDGKEVDIVDCLGKKFDYSKLMTNTFE